MKTPVHLAQAARRDVRVDLRRRRRRRDRAWPAPRAGRRRRRANGSRTRAGGCAGDTRLSRHGAAQMLLQELPDRLARQRARRGARERSRDAAGACPASSGRASAEIVVEPRAGVAPERHDALAAPLPHDADAVGIEIEIARAERDHLRHAQPGAVEQLEQRPIAAAERRIRRRRVEQRPHVGRVGCAAAARPARGAW